MAAKVESGFAHHESSQVIVGAARLSALWPWAAANMLMLRGQVALKKRPQTPQLGARPQRRAAGRRR